MNIDVYQHVTDKIVTALEAGTVPWRNPILGSQQTGWPKNLVSDKPYRGVNTFLLALTSWSCGYASPYWLTYRQAQARGGSVRKGEKSTLVVFWKQLIVEKKESNEKKLVPMIRYYRLFNTEQCDGVTVPIEEHDKQTEREFALIESAESIVKGYAGPEICHIGMQPRYRPPTDEVFMPEPKRFTSDEEYYSTLFHELVHSTGHSSRLDRGLDTELRPFGSPDYSREELIAEMGAAFLCAHAGIIPATLENSAAYIKGWISCLRADKKVVVQSAGAAQRAADLILGLVHDTESDD
jgi:antirestriction protein ArdC